MKQYKLTVIGIVCASLLYLISVLFNLEIFEALIVLLDELEHLEIDEIILPGFVLASFVIADVLRRNKVNRVSQEKLKIYRAMVQSTHHVLNNFLNQMLIVKMKAESTPGFDPKVLKIYDQIADEAQQQIHALSNISDVSEASIHESVRPK
ncbi:hypothetical protein [Marinomonas fungiae]|uniref:Histidine kinase n=1 Tax=Marinomonas fungiae TaxID=1137284 RepID=A0A0K6ILW1_9GAMM|nr:hypothetical protein [Marinomonas fungiae]CUB04322.1 hypothetical protein Ga0061065_106141 [Marinomonas fungiae]